MSWTRVNRSTPCPICTRTTWCTIGERGVCCMRIESGRPMKNGGWLHVSDAAPRIERRHAQPTVSLSNPDALLTRWRADTTPEQVAGLAEDLGVKATALGALGAVYSATREAWAFPMRDGAGRTVGIRLRASGRKWAVDGSREGLFYGDSLSGIPLICEGPTDCAAAISIGFNAVGRPSCTGGVQHVRDLLTRLEVAKAIIVSDDDEPGRRGAVRLAAAIALPHKILAVPAKDLRDFVRAGATGALVRDMLKRQEWQ